MTFTHPGYLFFLTLAVPIVIMHMVRARRRRVVISSILLWQQLARDQASSRAVKRLLPSFLLFLQLLVLIVTVIALARPSLTSTQRSSTQTIIIVDMSASMFATDSRPTRLQSCASIARRELNRNASYTVIAARAEPVTLAKDVGLDEALSVIEKTKAPSPRVDLKSSLSLANQLTAKKSGSVIVLTDSVGVDTQVKIIRPSVVSSHNVAISSFQTRNDTNDKFRKHWMASIRNYSPDKQKVQAILELDGRVVFSRVVSIAGHGRLVIPDNPSVSSIQVPRDGSIAKAILRIQPLSESLDVLSHDNTARLSIAMKRIVNISVFLSPGKDDDNPLLKALSLIPGIALSIHGRNNEGAISSTDFAIYDGFSPPKHPSVPTVLIGALPSFIPIDNIPNTATNGNEDKVTEAITWDKTHPSLRFVNLSGIAFQSPIIHKQIHGSKIIVEGRDSALIEEITSDSAPIIVMSFALTDSEFPAQTAFPIFITNLVEWAASYIDKSQSPSLEVGSVLDYRAQMAGEPVRIYDENGKLMRSNGLFSCDAPGFYTMTAGRVSRPFAVNFVDSVESDIANQPVVLNTREFDRPTPIKHKAEKTVYSVVYSPLLVLAFVFLVIEWLMYIMSRLGRLRPKPLWRRRQRA